MTYAAVVVRDLDVTARAWADVFSVPLPEVLDVCAQLPDGRYTAVRSAWFQFRNIRINLIQPVDRAGPFATYIASRGQGFHHIGFYVDDDPRARFDRLKAAGGTHVLGTRHTSYGEFDFRHSLGTAIEVNYPDAGCHPNLPRGTFASFGATSTVSDLTIAVRDIHDARTQYRSTLGMSMSPLRTVHCLEHNRTGTQRARAVIGTIRQNALALNVVQPVDGRLFDRSVDRLGGAFHHLGFRVREAADVLVKRLEKMNGRIVAGELDAGYVQVDMIETLGIVIDIAGVARHQ